MKIMSKIGLLVAASILMLHSFLPHQHHNEIADDRHFIEHDNADSILDYLKLAFHANLGENHLEEYEKASSVFLAFFPPCQTTYELNNAWVQQNDTEFEDQQFCLHESLLTEQSQFRGPPQLS